MVIPIPGDRGDPVSPLHYDRTMPVFSAQPSLRNRMSMSSQSTPGQARGGPPGDTRYSPTSPYTSPQSMGRPGISSPTTPRGILWNSNVNGTRNPRVIRSRHSPPTHYIASPIGEAQRTAESIERAARITDAIYNKDSQFPTLFQALVGRDHTGAVGLRAVSGNLDHDYPAVMERGLMTKELFTIESQSPIPAELKEMLGQTEGGICQMGLFPEISRAWMTIGTDLYLWDFRDGSDLSFYDGLKEPILALELIPAKANVFRANLGHVLCVTTLSEVIILGFIIVRDESSLGLATPARTTMEVIAHPLYTIPSDSVTLNVITGDSNGRIFIGGVDGYIYEVFYQAHRGWIRDKCWKTNMTKSLVSKYLLKFFPLDTADPIKDIVVDNRRRILYSLSARGTVAAYDLGAEGTEFTNLGSISLDNIINSVIVASRKSVDPASVSNIVSIATIDCGELNLVAMADSGTRIYFSCYNRPQSGVAPGTRPTTLQLAHIRLPPGCSPMSTMRKPSGATGAYYSNGLYIISAPSARESSALWLISPFIYPTENYAELVTVISLAGVTVDIKEICARDVSPTVLEQPEVMSQHLAYRREIVILTNQGTTVFKALKPYEILRELLLERQGPEQLRGHFEMLPNRVQPLANCVLLASHPFNFTDNVADFATKAIYLYGGGSSPVSTPTAGTSQRQVQFDLRNTPGGDGQNGMDQQTSWPGSGGGGSGVTRTFLSPSSPVGSPPMSSTFISPPSPMSVGSQGMQLEPEHWPYSPKHDAIYVTVGRILASFWNMKLIRLGTVEGTNVNVVMPNISGEQVSYAIHFIQNLHNFLVKNPSLYMTSYKVDVHVRQEMITTPEGRRLLDYENEKTSIVCLKHLLTHALEVLGMWKILCDHQIHIILQGVDERFLNSTLRDLIVSGQDIVPIIINSLISRYLGDNAAVDEISLRLREVCPTLFRNEDAISTKVAEILQKAKQTGDEREKEKMLQGSLSLCEKISGLTRANIRHFCTQFAELGFPLGAIKLCESAANGVDPKHLALGALKTTSVDPVSAQAHNQRFEIYQIIFEILDGYFAESGRQAPVAGRPSDRQQPSERGRTLADETFRGILASEDEVFQVMLFNWLLEKNLYERLLEIKHPFLDAFLQRAAETAIAGKWPRGSSGMNDKRILDLLWRHHEMNGDHVAATQILHRLAESTSSGLTLDDRLEYLARANICLKGSGRPGVGEDLESLEEKLEVAQVQKLIMDVLENRLNALAGRTTAPTFDHNLSAELKGLQDGIQRLNSQLFSNSELYDDFAVPFHLHELKVEIFRVAGYQNRSMIESFYADIVEAEMNRISREPMETQAEIIRQKIVSLGKKYQQSPIYFPIEYLVEHLEAMKPAELADQLWVVKIMLEVGVPFPELIRIYEMLWDRTTQRSDSNGTVGTEAQIARVVIKMVEAMLNRSFPMMLSRHHRSELIETCKGLLATMVVEFSSKFEREATELKNQLTAIKDRLDAAGH